MDAQDVVARIEWIEERVTLLEQLPARVDALTARVDTLTVRIDDLRVEMHHEFSAVRAEMRQLNADTVATLRGEMRQLDEKMNLFNQQSNAKMDQLIEQTNVHMRVLHEDVISRIGRSARDE